MPQLPDDPRGFEVYEFEGAGADLQRDRSKIRLPSLVESVGTDGRFLGAIRGFPGFAGDSLHGIPKYTDSNNPSGLTNIRLAKYVSIRKGLGSGVLRGIVYIADNTQDLPLDSANGFSWSSSQKVGYEQNYYVRMASLVTGRNDDDTQQYYDARLNIPSTAQLVINGTPTTRTAGFPASPLTAGQWGVHTTNFSEDTGDEELKGSYSTIYYRHDVGGTDPDSLGAGYLTLRLPGWSVYFAYWDSASGTSGVVELDNLRRLEGDPLGETLDEYDISSNGRYIYLVTGERASRAYWYDFDYTSWQGTQTTFANRYMGIYSPLMLQEFVGYSTERALTTLSSEQATNLPENMTAGVYWGGLELVSRKHGLRSLLYIGRREIVAPDNILKFTPASSYMAIYGTAPYKINGQWLSDVQKYWGLPQWDSIRIWRRLQEDTSGLTGADAQYYGRFYLENEVSKSFNPYTEAYIDSLYYGSTPTVGISQDLSFSMLANPTAVLAGFTVDQALAVGNNAYDPFLHEVGRVPESKRIECLDGATVVVAAPRVFVDTEKEWFYEGQLGESIMYSSLAMGELENFPTSNVWRPSTPGEVYHGLVKAGDFIVAIGSAGIYRLFQNGTEMAGTTLASGVGGVSRWGQCAVGSSVFVVTEAGFKRIDANTGAVSSMQAVDRMIFDERKWGDSIANIHVAYDAHVGAIVLLNTTEDEAVILWEATGAVTTLEDCPWAFLTQGPDAKTGGAIRAYFVTSTGVVHCIDAGREMATRTMCGGGDGGDDTLVRGTVAASSTSTVINVTADGTEDIPDDCVGFKVYINSGDLKGESSTITTRNGDLQFTVSPAFSAAPATGTKFSIAPIRFRVVGPQIRGTGGVYNSFERKRIQTIAPALTEIVNGDGEGSFQVGAYRRATKLDGVDVDCQEIPDRNIGYINAVGTQLYPYIESTLSDFDFELQALLVRTNLTGSESESRQGS